MCGTFCRHSHTWLCIWIFGHVCAVAVVVASHWGLKTCSACRLSCAHDRLCQGSTGDGEEAPASAPPQPPPFQGASNPSGADSLYFSTLELSLQLLAHKPSACLALLPGGLMRISKLMPQAELLTSDHLPEPAQLTGALISPADTAFFQLLRTKILE